MNSYRAADQKMGIQEFKEGIKRTLKSKDEYTWKALNEAAQDHDLEKYKQYLKEGAIPIKVKEWLMKNVTGVSEVYVAPLKQISEGFGGHYHFDFLACACDKCQNLLIGLLRDGYNITASSKNQYFEPLDSKLKAILKNWDFSNLWVHKKDDDLSIRSNIQVLLKSCIPEGRWSQFFSNAHDVKAAKKILQEIQKDPEISKSTLLDILIEEGLRLKERNQENVELARKIAYGVRRLKMAGASLSQELLPIKQSRPSEKLL